MLRLSYTMGRCPLLEKKNDQYCFYINIGSDHPKKVIKSLIALWSCYQNIHQMMIFFTQNKEDYENALKLWINQNSYIKVEKTIQR